MQTKFSVLGLVVSLVVMVGCAEATADKPPTGSTGGSGGMGQGGSTSGSTSSTGSTMGNGGAGGGMPNVVLNEISASGEEWVELVNVGNGVMDLSNFAVTDVLADGTPNLPEAARFEAGTSLSPGEYLLIVGKVTMPSPGPQTGCLMTGGPATCYQAAWGISASKGDTILFLSPTDTIVEQASYPANTIPAGNTFGRLPNGVGEFVANKPTPGEANAAP